MIKSTNQRVEIERSEVETTWRTATVRPQQQQHREEERRKDGIDISNAKRKEELERDTFVCSPRY